MRRKCWKATAAMVLAGALVLGAAGCGRASEIAKEAIGLNDLESKLVSTASGDSEAEGKDAEATSKDTKSKGSKAESKDTKSKDSKTKSKDTKSKDTKSKDSNAESAESKAESAESKAESAESKTESAESGAESAESGAESTVTPDESEAEAKTQTVTITGEGLDIAGLSALDNTRYTAGYTPNLRDELNRPKETVEKQERFGAENVEFLHGTDRTIRLVFTAGYTNAYTEAILNILKEKGLKATFFLTGYCMQDSPQIVQRILNEGHTLGSHSFSHPTEGMQSYSVEQIIEDSMKAQRLIRDTYGYEMQYYAFPSGEFSPRALETIKAMGYKVVFYSFACKDYDPNDMITPDDELAALYAQLHVGEVALLHASSPSSAAVLASFIDGVKQLGFRFENYWQ